MKTSDLAESIVRAVASPPCSERTVRSNVRSRLALVPALAAVLMSETAFGQVGGHQPGGWSEVLRNTAAIMEADVIDVSYGYDDITGPRTLTRFKNISRHRGTVPPDEELTLSTFGGPKPAGGFITASHVPSFAVGSRVVLFLTNRRWLMTPVYGGFSFRVMETRGRKVLTTDWGGLVTGVGMSAPEVLGQVATLEELASGARSLQPTMNTAAERAVDVKQFIAGVDAVAAQLGVQISGAFDPVPSLDGGQRWNVVPVAADSSTLTCQEPPMSMVPVDDASKLVCDGGAS